jgi:hypothetical protein
MRLNIEQLQDAVKRARLDKHLAETLRAQAVEAFGPSVDVIGDLPEIIDAVNETLDVFDYMGKQPTSNLKKSLLLKLKAHELPSARKVAARLLSEESIALMILDDDRSVRLAVARRMPHELVKEALRMHNDDEMLNIYHEKLNEAGVPDPEKMPMHLDLKKNVKPKSVRQQQVPELTEQWYESLSRKILSDLGTSLEYNWEEKIVHRYCSSLKATSGIVLDERKFLKAMLKIIDEKENLALERNSLKEAASNLRRQAEVEDVMSTPILEIVEEVEDPVHDMLSAGFTPAQYIERFNELFSVKFVNIPPAFKKFRMGESVTSQLDVPLKATVPGSSIIREVDERALDEYVKNWNTHQALVGEPLKIYWHVDPSGDHSIGFEAILR